MAQNKCKYAEKCPVYAGALKEADKPVFLYHNVFCLAGSKGWHACKRYHVYEEGIDPTESTLPENNEPVEDIIKHLRENNT